MEQDNIEQSARHIFNKVIVYGAAIIVCAVVALFVMQFLGGGNGESVSNEHIVLTFIGILATFIVVGNYTQVNAIKEGLDKRLDSLSEKTNNQRAEWKDDISASNSKIWESLGGANQMLYTSLIKMITTEQSKILNNVLNSPSHSYMLEYFGNKPKTNSAFAKVDKDADKIVFYTVNRDGSINIIQDDILKVDGILYSDKDMHIALQICNNHRMTPQDSADQGKDNNKSNSSY